MPVRRPPSFMKKWVEYRLIRSWDAGRQNPLQANYQLARDTLLPIFARSRAEHLLITNYLRPDAKEPEERDYMRYRVEATNEAHATIEAALDLAKATRAIVEVRKGDWSPEGDALRRLSDVSASLRAGGAIDSWILPDGTSLGLIRDRDKWIRTGMWSGRSEQQMVPDLAAMFVMVGGWAREFIEKFPQRPPEAYLLSLMLHLLLNGLGCSGPTQGEEPVIRVTPVI